MANLKSGVFDALGRANAAQILRGGMAEIGPAATTDNSRSMNTWKQSRQTKQREKVLQSADNGFLTSISSA
jgi:hypothetical protein